MEQDAAPPKIWLLTLVMIVSIISIKLEGVYIDALGIYEQCMADRFHPDFNITHSSDLSNMLLFISKALIPVFCAFTILKSPKVIPKLVIAVLCCYTLLNYLRDVIPDKKCHNKNNGISGHFAFHVYYFVSLPLLVYYARWARNPSDKVPLSKKLLGLGAFFAAAAFIGVSGWSLYRTWIYGFHTMSQILNGILFGLVANLVLYHLLHKIDIQGNIISSYEILVVGSVFAIGTATAMVRTGKSGLVPFEMALAAILWSLIFYYRGRPMFGYV